MKKNKIYIDRNDTGIGIYISHPEGKSVGDSKFQETLELVEELIDYVEEKSPVEIETLSPEIPYFNSTPLPEDTPPWIIKEVPYIWKNKQVIVSWDSLQYFESLYLNLKEASLKKNICQLSQIVYLRRASAIQDILNGIRKNLERIY